MFEIAIDNEVDMASWRSLYEKSTFSTFFQSPDCYHFYSKLSFMKPFVFAVKEDGQLTGLISGYLIANGGKLGSFFSQRAIVPGGVLLSPNISNEALILLLKKIKSGFHNKTIYIEIRNYHGYSVYKNIFEEAGFEYKPHLNFHLNLSDITEIWNKLSENRKRQIKQSERNDVICVEATTKDDVVAIYGLLSELYKSKIKKPLFPLSFFLQLSCEKNSKIFVVKEHEKILGGIVCVVDSKTIYQWFVCGESSPKIFPQTLAIWTAIKYGCDNGYKRFDFMGAGKPGRDYGVRDFKSRFGGAEVEYGRFLYVSNTIIYNLMSFLLKLISKK